jgi:hypothetical protein
LLEAGQELQVFCSACSASPQAVRIVNAATAAAYIRN